MAEPAAAAEPHSGHAAVPGARIRYSDTGGSEVPIVLQLSTPNTYTKLGRITAPLLIVAGGADLTAPPELMRTWARHAPPHDFAVVPDAGHSLSYERPAEFNRIVLEFLSGR
ncbi:hypothetical protein GCM10009559_28210 [Pseudonocardia zijingensis]|uniref:AB hydrolase-1 domain-containing protein n=1 Tax=Pseudonocardia zijingensis TaxID=153376 RepID=A0ABN1Q1N1_9PSEU